MFHHFDVRFRTTYVTVLLWVTLCSRSFFFNFGRYGTGTSTGTVVVRYSRLRYHVTVAFIQKQPTYWYGTVLYVCTYVCGNNIHVKHCWWNENTSPSQLLPYGTVHLYHIVPFFSLSLSFLIVFFKLSAHANAYVGISNYGTGTNSGNVKKLQFKKNDVKYSC